jgi:hypothetical protein
VRTLKSVALAALATVAIAGCYGSAVSSYNPGDASQLVQDVTRRGITILTTVSGDSACADPDLTNNALHLNVTDPSDGLPRDVYIYVFRAKTWDASAAQIDACQQVYAGAHPGANIERLDIPIYRVLGADWSSELDTLITAAVTEAAQAGTPP